MQPAVFTDFTQYVRGFRLFPTRSFLTKVYFDNEKKNVQCFLSLNSQITFANASFGNVDGWQ